MSHVEDPYAREVKNWGYQSLQTHQRQVVDDVALLAGLGPGSTAAESEEKDNDVKNQIKKLLEKEYISSSTNGNNNFELKSVEILHSLLQDLRQK